MGGRSRKNKDDKAESFAFVKSLTNERLEAYGKMSSGRVQNNELFGSTESGKPINPYQFNERLSKEYQGRNDGIAPSWDVSINGGLDNATVNLRRKAKKDREK